MIRTVRIPTTVSRMGCAPGGDCCASCRSHTGPPEGPAATHTHAIPSVRNVALKATLGDVQCDQDGNCYTDGVLTSAPLTTGAGCAPGVASCNQGLSGSGVSGIALYVGVGLLGVMLLEAFSRRR